MVGFKTRKRDGRVFPTNNSNPKSNVDPQIVRSRTQAQQFKQFKETGRPVEDITDRETENALKANLKLFPGTKQFKEESIAQGIPENKVRKFLKKVEAKRDPSDKINNIIEDIRSSDGSFSAARVKQIAKDENISKKDVDSFFKEMKNRREFDQDKEMREARRFDARRSDMAPSLVRIITPKEKANLNKKKKTFLFEGALGDVTPVRASSRKEAEEELKKAGFTIKK